MMPHGLGPSELLAPRELGAASMKIFNARAVLAHALLAHFRSPLRYAQSKIQT